MGKKFVVLMKQTKKYRLYSDDIHMVHLKTIKKAPQIPRFEPLIKSDDEDTQEIVLSPHDVTEELSLS